VAVRHARPPSTSAIAGRRIRAGGRRSSKPGPDQVHPTPLREGVARGRPPNLLRDSKRKQVSAGLEPPVVSVIPAQFQPPPLCPISPPPNNGLTARNSAIPPIPSSSHCRHKKKARTLSILRSFFRTPVCRTPCGRNGDCARDYFFRLTAASPDQRALEARQRLYVSRPPSRHVAVEHPFRRPPRPESTDLTFSSFPLAGVANCG